MKRILILDGDLGSSLAIVRSLGRAGYECHVASAQQKSLASYSRFSKESLIYPDPMTHEAEFLNWSKVQLNNSNWDLIIPVSERTLVPLMKIREASHKHKLAMAENSALQVVLDKTKTVALAQSLAVPQAASANITTLDQMPSALLSPFIGEAFTKGLPVVVKPGRSIGNQGQRPKKLEVKYAFSGDELKKSIENLLPYGEVILQEYFTGQGVGVELLAQDGEILYAFQHLRLHEIPLTGGASCYRQSVALNPQLLEASKKLIQALRWTGVAMVEFKLDPKTQNSIFIEINGRFWGSLPLAIAAGADFPKMLCQLYFNQHISCSADYQVPFYARQLGADLRWYEMVLRRQTPAGFSGPWENRSQYLREATQVFHSNHVFDIQSWSDPAPGWIDLKKVVSSYGTRFVEILKTRWAQKYQLRRGQSRTLTQKIQSAKSIQFVCYGNINRSALAESYFRVLAPDCQAQISSSGFHSQAGRPADPVMVQEARQMGVDLSSWASFSFNAETSARCDLIFVMDLSHLDRIASDCPDLVGKTYLLGSLVPAEVPSGEISDPYGLSRESYRQSLRQVTAGINQLLKIMKKSQSN